MWETRRSLEELVLLLPASISSLITSQDRRCGEQCTEGTLPFRSGKFALQWVCPLRDFPTAALWRKGSSLEGDEVIESETNCDTWPTSELRLGSKSTDKITPLRTNQEISIGKVKIPCSSRARTLIGLHI